MVQHVCSPSVTRVLIVMNVSLGKTVKEHGVEQPQIMTLIKFGDFVEVREVFDLYVT